MELDRTLPAGQEVNSNDYAVVVEHILLRYEVDKRN